MLKIPPNVQFVLDQLKAHEFEAFVVGGCVRDMLRGVAPKDWDITTNALPQEIEKIFPETLYNNRYGTVVVRSGSEEIEVTPFRKEAKYTDKRHPDKVEFGTSLEEDLKRRDFTINALAFDGQKIIDLFAGQEDLKKKIIRTVGRPGERFSEDALRLMRAIRFAAELNWQIEDRTWQAIRKYKKLIEYISAERIRDELIKILSSGNSFLGFWLLEKSGLLAIILPELQAGVGVTQNRHHLYTVFFHSLLSLQYCPSEDYLVRLAALLHDLAKPQTKQGEGPYSTFYGHEIVGTKQVIRLMRRLKFSRKEVDKVAHLVRYHMFYSDTDILTDAGVRRLLRRVGKENIKDLIDLRVADRMGLGCQLEKPRRLLELEQRIINVQKDPIDTRMLAINGHQVMAILKWKPGVKIGLVLSWLLEEVLEDPQKNNPEYLTERAKEIAKKIEKISNGEARQQVKKLTEQWEGKFRQDWEQGLASSD